MKKSICIASLFLMGLVASYSLPAGAQVRYCTNLPSGAKLTSSLSPAQLEAVRKSHTPIYRCSDSRTGKSNEYVLHVPAGLEYKIEVQTATYWGPLGWAITNTPSY